MYCRECGQLISNESSKCTNCGTEKGLGDNYCYKCGSIIKKHDLERCEFCGANLMIIDMWQEKMQKVN